VNRRTRKALSLATLLPRRIVGALSSLLVATVATATLAAPAQAEEGFQYWNYFHLENDAWAFSQVGTADFKPEDGTVEGFRFGTSTASQGIEPRADLAEVNFDTVCAGTEAAEGEKRVAVVIDYGTDEGNGTPPEPRADCATVPTDATTNQVLEDIAEVRVEGGMMCALDGYPASGCGTPVKDAQVATDEEPVAFALPESATESVESAETSDAATEPAAAEEESGNGMLWTLVVVALLVLLALGAVLMNRRRSKA